MTQGHPTKEPANATRAAIFRMFKKQKETIRNRRGSVWNDSPRGTQVHQEDTLRTVGQKPSGKRNAVATWVCVKQAKPPHMEHERFL